MFKFLDLLAIWLLNTKKVNFKSNNKKQVKLLFAGDFFKNTQADFDFSKFNFILIIFQPRLNLPISLRINIIIMKLITKPSQK